MRWIGALFLLLACQSDEDRLNELRSRESSLSLSVLMYERMMEDAQARWDSTDYPADSLMAWTDTIPLQSYRDSLAIVRRDIRNLLE